MRLWLPCIAFLMVGCSATDDVKRSAVAIDRFHRQLDAQQFGAIYSATDPLFKAQSSSADFQKFLGAVHRKMGIYAGGSRSTWNINYTPTGTFLTVHFTADYQRGRAQETFTFRANGANQAMVGYNISSPVLVLS